MTRPSGGRIILNVLSTWGGQAVSLALSFLATPFIVGALGDSAYGVWLLTLSVVGFMGLLDLGVRGAVTRYVARFSAVQDHESASHVASSALRIFLVTAAIVVALAGLIAGIAIDRFSIPAVYLQPARIVLVLAGLNLGVSLIGGTYAGALAACNRIDLLNIIDVVTGVFRTLGTVAALAAGYGLVTMAVIQLLVSVVRIAGVDAVLHRVYPSLRIDWTTADRTHVRLIFAFSLFSFLIHLSGRVIYYTDALVIGAFLPVAAVTTFGIASALTEYARMLISSVSYATSPVASMLEGAGDYPQIQRLLLNTVAASMMILLPVAVTFLIRGESFIGLWMGPLYAEPSGRVLAILSVPLLLHAAAHGLGGIMLAIGRYRPMIPAMLVEAVANLVLSMVLIRTMGVAGVAWGTAIPSVVSSVLFWPLYLHRSVGVGLGRYVLAAWLRPALAITPFTLATYLVERWLPAPSLPVFFGQVAVCTALAALGGWWLCLGQELRAGILDRVRHRLTAASTALPATRLASRESDH